jgi:hypothetical protein
MDKLCHSDHEGVIKHLKKVDVFSQDTDIVMSNFVNNPKAARIVTMKIFLSLLIALFVFSSCFGRSQQAIDKNADAKLGISGEEADDAEETLLKLQEQQRQEQRRQLERQITDQTQQTQTPTL